MILQETEASSLLQAVFEFLDGAEIEYCVQRNYEGYPDHLTGDVDLVVGESNLIRAANGIMRVASRLGWGCYQHHVWEKTAYIGLASDVFPNRFALTIELFAGARWHGLPFLDALCILKGRSKHRVTWKPRPAHQAIITSIHHLLYNNQIPKKYRSEVLELAQSNAEEMERDLRIGFGKTLAARIKSKILAAEWRAFDARFSRRLKATIIFRTLVLNPIDFFRVTVMGLLANSQRPEGVIIYVGLPNRVFAGHLCDRLLEIGFEWHIFAPPMRNVIDESLPNVNALRLVKKTMASGGVAIITNPMLSLRESVGASFPIYEIGSEKNCLCIFCDGKKIANYKELGSTSMNDIKHQAYEIWNDLLAHRAISYRSYVNEYQQN